jgi:DNA-directed RNA polymerase specialized sigma24 family protein
VTAWRRELLDGEPGRVWLYATARRPIANQRRASRRRVALHERLALEAASARREAPVTDDQELR